MTTRNWRLRHSTPAPAIAANRMRRTSRIVDPSFTIGDAWSSFARVPGRHGALAVGGTARGGLFKGIEGNVSRQCLRRCLLGWRGKASSHIPDPTRVCACTRGHSAESGLFPIFPQKRKHQGVTWCVGFHTLSGTTYSILSTFVCNRNRTQDVSPSTTLVQTLPPKIHRGPAG